MELGRVYVPAAAAAFILLIGLYHVFAVELARKYDFLLFERLTMPIVVLGVGLVISLIVEARKMQSGDCNYEAVRALQTARSCECNNVLTAIEQFWRPGPR